MAINIKEGFIKNIDEDALICVLRHKGELDEEVIIDRGLLSDEQNAVIQDGHLVRYNKRSAMILFKVYGTWM